MEMTATNVADLVAELDAELDTFERQSMLGVAMHEAAHAVVANRLKFDVRSVNLSLGTARGSTDIDEFDHQRSVERAADMAAVLWAGPLAAEHYELALEHDGNATDIARIAVLADFAALGHAEADAFTAWTRARAEVVLRDYAPAIERVAWRLVSNGHLTGIDLAEIVGATPSRRAAP